MPSSVGDRKHKMKPHDYTTLLEILSLIYEDMAVDGVEERFVELVNEVFSFDRLALFYVKHNRRVLHGKLSRGFAPNLIESMEVPLDEGCLLVKPLVSGFPVWPGEVEADDPHVKLLGLKNAALIPMVNKKRLRCWEVMACGAEDCPAFGKRWLRCWLVSGTRCKDGREVSVEKKAKMCQECMIFADQSYESVEGVMLVDNSPSGRPVSDDVVTMLAIIGHAVGVAINNSKLYLKTLESAIRDELTKLHNRRYFNERLVDEMERTKRYKESITLVMCDIDHFKRINDMYGHLMGDAVLCWVGDLLKDRLRKSDVIARYGGEEFTILLLNTDRDGGVEIAETLRKALEEARYPHGQEEISLTASFGVATFAADAVSWEGLMARADKALYCAKAQGRNKVCCV